MIEINNIDLGGLAELELAIRLERIPYMVDEKSTCKETFICVLCGFCCHSTEKLIGHIDSCHKDNWKFVCYVCGFLNIRADNLGIHML